MNVVYISYITCSMFRVNSVGFYNFWYRTYNQNLTGSRGEKSDATTVPHGHFRKLIIPTEFALSMFQHALELIQKQNLVFSKRRSDFIRKVSLICTICFRWAIKWTWYLQATDFQYPHFFSFVFNVFDNNGDGFIEFDEFLQVRTLNWLSMTSNLACFRFFGSRVRSEGQFRDQLYP